MNTAAWVALLLVVAVAAFFTGRSRARRGEQELMVSVESTDGSAESLAQLQAMIDHLPMGVTLFDPSGVVMVKNSSARSMSGVRHIDALVDDAVERLATATPVDSTRETTLAVTGPPARNYALSSFRLESGEVMVFVDDVTTRERLESMRRDFVANLSHELKTPLGGMAALSDSMIGETDHAVIARLAERVASEAQRMSMVIDDLLDLSRIESRADVRFEDVDIASIVNEAISLQRLNAD